MANKKNNSRIELPAIGKTKDGVIYKKSGNCIKVFSSAPEYKGAINKKRQENLLKKLNPGEFDLGDFYNGEINCVLPEFNPNNLDKPVFLYDKQTGYVGTTIVVFNLATDEQDSRVIFRPTLGDLMEIVWVMAHIGDEFIDKRLYRYKFGTPLGSEKFFEQYVRILEDDDDTEPVRIKMMYTAGLIKGFCQEKAWCPSQMTQIVDEVHLFIMTDVDFDNEDEDGKED